MSYPARAEGLVNSTFYGQVIYVQVLPITAGTFYGQVIYVQVLPITSGTFYGQVIYVTQTSIYQNSGKLLTHPNKMNE